MLKINDRDFAPTGIVIKRSGASHLNAGCEATPVYSQSLKVQEALPLLVYASLSKYAVFDVIHMGVEM